MDTIEEVVKILSVKMGYVKENMNTDDTYRDDLKWLWWFIFAIKFNLNLYFINKFFNNFQF